jgi:hypothetical protein
MDIKSIIKKYYEQPDIYSLSPRWNGPIPSKIHSAKIHTGRNRQSEKVSIS